MKYLYLKEFCILITIPSLAIFQDYFIFFNVDRNFDVEPIEKHAHILAPPMQLLHDSTI